MKYKSETCGSNTSSQNTVKKYKISCMFIVIEQDCSSLCKELSKRREMCFIFD